MFLASDSVNRREESIRRYLGIEPSVALVLAAVNFEWTVCRAILFLSETPNRILRPKMADYYSLDKYKKLWSEETGHIDKYLPLAVLVQNWSAVREGFTARNRLVHGKDRYTRKMAAPHVEALLNGSRFIDTYCEYLGKPLNTRMPIRKRVNI